MNQLNNRQLEHLLNLLQRDNDLEIQVRAKDGEWFKSDGSLRGLYNVLKKASNDSFTRFIERAKEEGVA